MHSYKWSAILDPIGLRPKFNIGELVRCISRSDELMAGSWISYGDLGLVKEVQFFKREKIVDGAEEVKTYPSIVCEVEVFWMQKNDSAWVLESLLESLEI